MDHERNCSVPRRQHLEWERTMYRKSLTTYKEGRNLIVMNFLFFLLPPSKIERGAEENLTE